MNEIEVAAPAEAVWDVLAVRRRTRAGLLGTKRVRDHGAAEAFDVRPRGAREAIRDALTAPSPS